MVGRYVYNVHGCLVAPYDETQRYQEHVSDTQSILPHAGNKGI